MSIRARSRKSKGTAGFILTRALARLFLIAYSCIVLYPLLWTVSGSLRTNATFFKNFYSLFSEFHFENYIKAWGKAGVSSYFMNTVYISFLSLGMMLVMATTAAYAISRFKFKLNKPLKMLYVAGLLLPGMAGIIPQYMLLWSLRMLDSRFVVALMMAVGMMPLGVFLLLGFFKTIPTELAEAGIIDGASNTQLFLRVMLPLCTPGMIPLLIIEFIYAWNEVYFSYILLSSSGKRTLGVGLMNLQKAEQQRGDFVVQFAAIVIVMIPTMIFYIAFQKRIIEGATLGALKD